MTGEIAMLAVFAALALGCEVARRTLKKRPPGATKLAKMLPKLLVAGSILGSWLFVCKLLPMVFGSGEAKHLSVELAPARTQIFGLSVSQTVITTWALMAIILALAALVRIFVLPRMQAVPKGLQNVLELAIDGIDKYAGSKAHGLGHGLSSYLFTVAVLLLGCAVAEMIGIRQPLSDITMTLALALITFILINYYGIKRKGPIGRIKSLNAQGPVVMVLRVISDVAIPISMACRLFGNMLGGMIVVELLYSAMGNMAVGIPSVIGLYFNVFHPLIQGFIFITLTLTFIDEAIE